MFYYVVDPIRGDVERYESLSLAVASWAQSDKVAWVYSNVVQLESESDPSSLRKLLRRFGVEPEEKLAEQAFRHFASMPTLSRKERLMAKAKETATKPVAKTVKKFEGDIDSTHTIHISKDGDAKPRREGTKVAKIFDTYENGITVANWVEKAKVVGGGLSNLRKDLAHGRVTLKGGAKKAA